MVTLDSVLYFSAQQQMVHFDSRCPYRRDDLYHAGLRLSTSWFIHPSLIFFSRLEIQLTQTFYLLFFKERSEELIKHYFNAPTWIPVVHFGSQTATRENKTTTRIGIKSTRAPWRWRPRGGCNIITTTEKQRKRARELFRFFLNRNNNEKNRPPGGVSNGVGYNPKEPECQFTKYSSDCISLFTSINISSWLGRRPSSELDRLPVRKESNFNLFELFLLSVFFLSCIFSRLSLSLPSSVLNFFDLKDWQKKTKILGHKFSYRNPVKSV